MNSDCTQIHTHIIIILILIIILIILIIIIIIIVIIIIIIKCMYTYMLYDKYMYHVSVENETQSTMYRIMLYYIHN